MSRTVEELGTIVKEKKSTLMKSCKESSKRDTEMHTMSESVVGDAKVEDGDKGRLRKTLEQLRKERDEENEVRAFLEEMQQNL